MSSVAIELLHKKMMLLNSMKNKKKKIEIEGMPPSYIIVDMKWEELDDYEATFKNEEEVGHHEDNQLTMNDCLATEETHSSTSLPQSFNIVSLVTAVPSFSPSNTGHCCSEYYRGIWYQNTFHGNRDILANQLVGETVSHCTQETWRRNADRKSRVVAIRKIKHLVGRNNFPCIEEDSLAISTAA